MQNSTHAVDYLSDPKYQWFANLQRKCYQENITHSTILNENYNEGDVWCERTFDGFSCWDETPAASTAYQPCPEFVVGFDPKRFVYKTCTENGTWFEHPEAKKPWTNYTTCVDIDDLDFRNIVNIIYVVGYTLSVAALLVSVFIFVYFRTLHCIRIRIHIHLFISIILNNVLWIIWYRAVVNRVSVVQDNAVWCQVLHVVTNYFMLTSYAWMCCEGIHLHIALVVVFVRDDGSLPWFVRLGWGGSLVIILIYATARFFSPGDTERCWMDQSDTFWIIIVPVLVSLMASFVFLVNVVRILITKLHSAATRRAYVPVKKAARAALILTKNFNAGGSRIMYWIHGNRLCIDLPATLYNSRTAGPIFVPLFGLHFLLLPFRPPPDSIWEKIYQIVSALLTSLQGLCVATLFCFTNHDVIVATKSHYARVRANNEGLPMTGTGGVTGAESLVNTRDHVI